MERKHYQTLQYAFIILFIAFFVYIVSWRCESSFWGTLLCGPKVISLAIWFVASLIMLKIVYARMKRSTDEKEAAFFWVIGIILLALNAAAFYILFVMNYV